MGKTTALLIALIIAISCKQASPSSGGLDQPNEEGLDFALLSDKIIERSAVQPGEHVLLMMAPGAFNELVDLLATRIKENGGIYLGTLSVTNEQPEAWSTAFTNQCAGKNIKQLEALFAEVDLGIMLPGATQGHEPYKALQNILKNGIKRTIHFHWAGAYDLNGNLLEIDEEKGLFYQNVILNTDYIALSTHQQIFEAALRGSVIHVTTPEGTDILF